MYEHRFLSVLIDLDRVNGINLSPDTSSVKLTDPDEIGRNIDAVWLRRPQKARLAIFWSMIFCRRTVKVNGGGPAPGSC